MNRQIASREDVSPYASKLLRKNQFRIGREQAFVQYALGCRSVKELAENGGVTEQTVRKWLPDFDKRLQDKLLNSRVEALTHYVREEDYSKHLTH